MNRVIVVRYGELSLKGKNRPEFEEALRRGILRAMDQIGARGRVIRTYGRFFVLPNAAAQADPSPLLGALQRVFGVVSVSPAVQVPASMDAFRATALQVLQEHLASRAAWPDPLPFRVESHRADKLFPVRSQDLNRDLGAYLLEAEPRLKVNLSDPALTVFAEVREGAGYVYSQVLPGPGGLPYGTSGRAMLLLSGGIDSPVAGWMAMKRGIRLHAVHFESPPFTSLRAREKVLDLCRVLAGWGEAIKVHVVPVTEIQKAIRQNCPDPLSITLLRRFMLRIAEELARRDRAQALITGDSVGQVASQTLQSIETINAVTSFPVLRPLVSMDKTEIMEMARRIGTYDLSIQPYEDCCTLFAPRQPRTRPTPGEAEAAERSLDVAALVRDALAHTEAHMIGHEGSAVAPSD